MNICHVNLARGFRGGERQTELLIRALAGEGIAQRLVCRKDSPLLSRLSSVSHLDLVPTGKPYARSLTRIGGADLVHAHEAKAAQLACLGSVWPGVPYVITRRVPNLPKDNFFTRAVYGRAAATVALSTAIVNSLRERDVLGELPVIPSMCAGLPVHPGRVVELRDRYKGRFVVGHVGALVVRDKGQDLLIESARRLGSDYQFVFVGSGRDEARLREQAKGLDNVDFVGFQAAVGDYFGCFDVFAFPSRHEGLGSTLLDAMEQRVPIIAAATGGIPDVVEHEQTGLLVLPDDVTALTEAIARLKNDPSMRNALAERASQRLSRYYPRNIAGRYLALYKQILALPGAKRGAL